MPHLSNARVAFGQEAELEKAAEESGEYF